MMKWLQCCGVALALAAMNSSATAGIFSSSGGCTDSKACGCDSSCQPNCCKPTITRPCNVNVHTYQRKCSDIKPPCCDTCDGPAGSCCPSACGPACDPKCAAPCGNNGCSTDPNCACPNGGDKCDPNCGCPNGGKACDPACAAPNACANGGKACDPACAAPCGNNACAADPNCAAPCNSGCDSCDGGRCCDADPCEVAKLIYTSQTACYAKDRAEAIEDLGNKFDCVCNPEILTAMVYALNDADERVRKEAADEIGDQLRKNPCCCSKEIVAALTCALGDCDRGVRRQAEEGLEACGYEVVDGCCDSCDSCGSDGCNNGCAPAAAPAPAAPEAAPAKEAAPPAEAPKETYFPSRLRDTKQTRRSAPRRGLANLFSLLD